MTRSVDVSTVVDLARHAPSVHNTQPWAFRAHGDHGVVELWADETRRLPVMDPDARQQTISCGAALYLARLGMRLQGFDAVVTLLPAGRGGPLAQMTAVAGASVTAEEVVLERAARARHMQRGIFEDRPVDPAAVDAIRAAAHAEGAWVRLLESPADQVPVAVLLARADELQSADEAYREEVRTWAARPAEAWDGLTAEAAHLGAGVRGSDLRLRDFSPGQPGPTPAPDEPPPAEHPLVAVLGTAGDEPADWLAAGQALCALLLQAEVHGVAASPLGQVLDQPWTRRRLAGELSLVGHPQMVLRLGHARQGPPTPRRPTSELLT